MFCIKNEQQSHCSVCIVCAIDDRHYYCVVFVLGVQGVQGLTGSAGLKGQEGTTGPDVPVSSVGPVGPGGPTNPISKVGAETISFIATSSAETVPADQTFCCLLIFVQVQLRKWT